jgi:tetratricopeptide (TPR) repeat protein
MVRAERCFLAFTTLLASCMPLLGAHPCAVCHAKQVAGYARTGMARSLALPEERQQPSGSFEHKPSGTTFEMHSSDVGLTQTIERRGIRAQYPIAYVVGSGSHAYAYVVRVGDYLFQSPVSYYARRGVWDMAPGFEQDRLPDFTRPVTPECLLCHAGSVFPVDGTLNRFKPPYVGALGISCDRCHGPVEAHLRNPSRANIVNPARLAPAARDSVCEQCHLSGDARVANPGRQVSDFQPGEATEDVFSTYVFDNPQSKSENSIKVISHSEQLRKSVCAQKSHDRLWCGTCHDPHNEPAEAKIYYRDRCLSCHVAPLAKMHPEPSDDCVGCHMPTRPAVDGGHTAFTDHRITRRPAPGVELARERLVAWREPPEAFRERDLALAYLAVGDSHSLTQYTEIGWHLLQATQANLPSDPAVLTGLGVACLRNTRSADAVQFFEQVVKLEPASAAYRVNLATALMNVGKLQEAERSLNHAIELDPSLEVAYRRLAEVYGKSGDASAIDQVFRRYLKFRPQSLAAREALHLP